MRGISRIFGIALVAVFTLVAASSAGSAPANVLFGTNGHDTIVATPAADVIYAKSGNDTITGVGDGDVVYASSGNDKIYTLPFTVVSGVVIEANVGHDRIESTTGGVINSSINGGSGNDVIIINGCGNDVRGESGNDKYTNTNGPTCSANTASLGNGHDEVFLLYASDVHLGNGNDTLRTISPGAVIAGSGNDKVEIQLGGDADVQLGAGHDFLKIETAGNVTAYGSNGRDRIVITHAGNNVINAGDGDDRFELSLAANNALDGGPGRADKVVIDPASSGNTCQRVERVVDWGGHAHPASCT